MAGGRRTLAIIDDHEALNHGISVLLERRGFVVVGAATDAGSGEELLLREKPELALIDLGLPDMGGDALIRNLRRQLTDVRFVVYTGLADPVRLGDALSCGAEGFVGKPASFGALVDALRAVARGERCLDPELSTLIEAGRGSAAGVLSDREGEVLKLLASGLTGEKIAEKLVLSPETIRTHIRNAMAKLEARTRTEAVVRAMQRKEISS